MNKTKQRHQQNRGAIGPSDWNKSFVAANQSWRVLSARDAFAQRLTASAVVTDSVAADGHNVDIGTWLSGTDRR